MPFCARCGGPVGDADTFCVACGAPRRDQPARLPPVGPRPEQPASLAQHPAAQFAAERQRSLHARSRLVIGGLAVIALLGIAMALTAAAHLGDLFGLAHTLRLGEDLTTEYTRRQEGIGGVLVLVQVATAVLWLAWQHRAHANLRQLGAGNLRFTPGWGVGWWFIPFANLWQPYRAVRELWTVSRPHPDGRRRTAAPVVGWWWAAFVSANVAFNIGLGVDVEALTVGDAVIGGALIIASQMLTLVAVSLAVIVVLDIVRGQRELHQSFAELLGSGRFAG